MTPDCPGRWRVRLEDGRETIYHVDRMPPQGDLWVLAEENGPPLHGAVSSVRQWTETMQQLGIGAWVDRVGDLPVTPAGST